MAFDSSVITEVYPPQIRGSQVTLRWTSTEPAGTWYQVYVGGSLTWSGQSLFAVLDLPRGLIHVDIGSVDDGEQKTDFSGSLTPAENRARLTWTGGYELGSDLLGFHVYGEDSPGLGIDYNTILATIAAYDQGIDTGGYGLGGYGSGVYGSISGTYTWESGPLTKGTWSFGVKSFDRAGNEGSASTTNVAITSPPRPVSMNSAGKRLTYTYSASTNKITLNWLASTG